MHYNRCITFGSSSTVAYADGFEIYNDMTNNYDIKAKKLVISENNKVSLDDMRLWGNVQSVIDIKTNMMQDLDAANVANLLASYI